MADWGGYRGNWQDSERFGLVLIWRSASSRPSLMMAGGAGAGRGVGWPPAPPAGGSMEFTEEFGSIYAAAAAS